MSSLAAIAALIGDPSRAAMLQALLPGEALTAGELARVAGIGAPAASAQLRALTEAGLLRVHAQGRHRFFALGGVDLAAARGAPRFACDCMDWSERQPHLAGGLAREVTALLLRRGWLVRPAPDAADALGRRRLACTPEGRRALAAAFGVEA